MVAKRIMVTSARLPKARVKRPQNVPLVVKTPSPGM